MEPMEGMNGRRGTREGKGVGLGAKGAKFRGSLSNQQLRGERNFNIII